MTTVWGLKSIELEIGIGIKTRALMRKTREIIGFGLKKVNVYYYEIRIGLANVYFYSQMTF